MKKQKTSPSAKTLAIFALLIVALSYSLLSVGARLLNEEFAPMTGVYLRVGIAALVSFFLFRKSIRFSRLKTVPQKDYLPLFFMGVIGYTVSVWFITMGVLTTTLVNYTVIFGTLPLFTFLFTLIFLRHKPKPILFPLVMLSLYGVSVIASKSFLPNLNHFGAGELFALLGAATGAFYYGGRKMLSDHLNTSEISLLVMIIACITALFIALANGQSFHLTAFGNWHIVVGLGIGAICNILATYLGNFAIEHLDATFGTQLLLTDNIFAAILGYLFYHEVLTPIEIVGACIIIGSVFISNRLLTE